MAWEKPNFITLTDLYVAYRKAKVDVYYERVNIAAFAFADYEADLKRNLRRLLKRLNQRRPDWFDKATFVGSHAFIPKSIDPDPFVVPGSDAPHFFSSDADARWKAWCQELGKPPKVEFRVIGQHPIEFHIVATLWILKVGQFFDSCLGPEAMGSRLRRYTQIDDERDPSHVPQLNPDAVGCFRPYAIDFKRWRSLGLTAIRTALGRKESVVAITMDIRLFYHRVNSEFLLDPDFLAATKLDLSVDQQVFTRQLITALTTWSRRAGQLDKKRMPIGLPVGLTASKIIANVALLAFDRAVKRDLTPIYFGRYVDDVFLVLQNSHDFATSTKVGEFIVDRLRGLLEKNDDARSYRYVPRYDKGRSIMEFAEAKQKVFALSGQAGIDLIESIEEQLRDASSEWRMLADLPEDEGELLKNILCPGADASAAVDNLRKADGISVRRLGLSLVLRNLEAIERDLPPIAWRNQRRTFYAVVLNHVLTVPGLFDFFPLLPRIVGLAVACGEPNEAQRLVRRFEKIVATVKQTAEVDPPNSADSCEAYAARAFALSALQALGPSSSRSEGFLKLWRQLERLAKEPLVVEDAILPTAFRLWLSDLGRQSYRESLMERGSHTKKEVPDFPDFQIDRGAENALRIPDIKRFLEAASLTSNVFLGALVFPTRPFSPAEVTQLIPQTLVAPEQFLGHVKALRGLSITQRTACGVGGDANENVDLIYLPLEGAPVRPLVAIPCLLTQAGSWKSVVRGQLDPDLGRYFRINRLVNDILHHPKKPDYVVFPELSIPRNWYGRIAHKLAQSGISVIAGLEYQHHGKSAVSNQLWASLITDILGYRIGVIHRQEKEFPALHEERDLWQQAQVQLVPINTPRKPVIRHGQFAFGLLLCSELTDMKHRLSFRGNVDAVFVAEWNQDTNTFASLVEAAALDVHCYVIQVNNRTYGDSRIRAPAKEPFHRDVVRLQGGETDYFVVGELNIPALREFQAHARSPEKPFKPLPSGFKMASFRKSQPPLET